MLQLLFSLKIEIWKTFFRGVGGVQNFSSVIEPVLIFLHLYLKLK